MTFVPSPQQTAVLEWTSHGTGSAIVRAVAGAGKTTTLIQLLSRTRGSVAFCAYNTNIVSEIEAKVAPLGLGNRVRCGTFHSFGFSAVRRAFPSIRVSERDRRSTTQQFLLDRYARIYDLDEDEATLVFTFIFKLISLAKQRSFGSLVHYSDHGAWLELVDHFGLEEEMPEEMPYQLEALLNMAKIALEWQASNVQIIDFDDMIWLPLVRKLRMWQNDWVLVDEAQDTNPARRALARRMLSPGGRAVFVGDDRQAIYGFTGADGDALDLIRREFNARVLPLTVTHRCSKAVVAHARRWVDHIEAHETAPDGVVRSLPYELPEAA